mgnify:CR=1 FL=1
MRSKSVNVSEIAQSIGGGGHIRAAWCELYIKNLMEQKISYLMLLSKE